MGGGAAGGAAALDGTGDGVGSGLGDGGCGEAAGEEGAGLGRWDAVGTAVGVADDRSTAQATRPQYCGCALVCPPGSCVRMIPPAPPRTTRPAAAHRSG
jgi:hypothetical protein